MKTKTESIVRIVGAIVGGILFAAIGVAVADFFDLAAVTSTLAFGVVGLILGFLIAPFITIKPMRWLRRSMLTIPADRLTAIIAGIFMGLVAAALLTLPLSLLPSPFRELLPLLSAILFCYLSVVLLTARHLDLQIYLKSLTSQSVPPVLADRVEEEFILLDTSVIIDGRITDISRSGFLRQTLLVPNFILLELQHIADSADSLRRNRGRRGLDVLGILQEDPSVAIQITDMDVTDVRDADSKLVALARNLHCPIMTNDYNLNRVAELQGVSVLNINDLANAVKAAYLPGEELNVRIIQEGKEDGQGVGYLDDGTMVVVENGRRLLNRSEKVVVTKVLQTAAGRMIFART